MFQILARKSMDLTALAEFVTKSSVEHYTLDYTQGLAAAAAATVSLQNPWLCQSALEAQYSSRVL
jgi:hypothetical protein